MPTTLPAHRSSHRLRLFLLGVTLSIVPFLAAGIAIHGPTTPGPTVRLTPWAQHWCDTTAGRDACP